MQYEAAILVVKYKVVCSNKLWRVQMIIRFNIPGMDSKINLGHALLLQCENEQSKFCTGLLTKILKFQPIVSSGILTTPTLLISCDMWYTVTNLGDPCVI